MGSSNKPAVEWSNSGADLAVGGRLRSSKRLTAFGREADRHTNRSIHWIFSFAFKISETYPTPHLTQRGVSLL